MLVNTKLHINANSYSSIVENENYNNQNPIGNFGEILNEAIQGVELSDNEIIAWEKNRVRGNGPSGPDEVEKAAMLKGFTGEFCSGLPADLEIKLKNIWSQCNSIDKKYNYMDAYSFMFSSNDIPGGVRWTHNWKQCISVIIDYMKKYYSSSKDRDNLNLIPMLEKLL